MGWTRDVVYIHTDMQKKIKRFLVPFLMAVFAFASGVAGAVRWIAPDFRSVSTSMVALRTSEHVKDNQTSVPKGWKKVEFKNQVVMLLPEDMKPIEPLGDSRSYREAYSNGGLSVTILHGEFEECVTSHVLLDRPTYHESLIEIGGRKAALGVDLYPEPNFSGVKLCFLNKDENNMQLRAAAFCRDDRALEAAQQIFKSIRFKGDPL
jgi:hypothetical protein